MILRQLLVSLLTVQALLVLSQSVTVYPDVIKYEAVITPDLDTRSIEGSVIIDFTASPKKNQVYFDCGNLVVSSVKGPLVKRFHQNGNQLIIQLSAPANDRTQVEVAYTGSPKRGLIFKENLAYTVFSTDQWMVCNMDPSDKAQFSLEIIAPDSLDVITSNTMQNYDAPAYTFGFALGSFNKCAQLSNGLSLTSYSDQYSERQLLEIFRETPHVLAFLEEKSGVDFYHKNYRQVLAGDHYQEMSGFAMIKSSYGSLVLDDATETNLITHELAHQWWGNQITCQSWNHFWLNEAFATYLSAAYNEVRFGKEKYQSDIESYYGVYQKVVEKGADKPLVFKDWSNPSGEDRSIVYFKGAYVLHLLRAEMGDQAFWDGIKLYSQTYFGKSVTTPDFQQAMERASEKSLKEFFDRWVY